jgi:hypothetical protein
MKYFIFLFAILLQSSIYAQTPSIPKIFYLSDGLQYSEIELNNKNHMVYRDFTLNPNGYFEKQNIEKYGGFIFRNSRWEEEGEHIKFSLNENNDLYIEDENILITKASKDDLSHQDYILEDLFLKIKMQKGASSTKIELLTTNDTYHLFEEVIDYRDLREKNFSSINQFIQAQCNQNYFETSSSGLVSFQSKIVYGVAKCDVSEKKGHIVHSYYNENEELVTQEVAGDWSIQKIGDSDIEILMIEPFDEKDGYHTFFSEVNGVLYRGEFIKKGTKESLTIFNKIAMDSIKNSMIAQKNLLFENSLDDKILLAIN